MICGNYGKYLSFFSVSTFQACSLTCSLPGEAPPARYSPPRSWPGPSTLARPPCSSSVIIIMTLQEEAPWPAAVPRFSLVHHAPPPLLPLLRCRRRHHGPLQSPLVLAWSIHSRLSTMLLLRNYHYNVAGEGTCVQLQSPEELAWSIHSGSSSMLLLRYYHYDVACQGTTGPLKSPEELAWSVHFGLSTMLLLRFHHYHVAGGGTTGLLQSAEELAWSIHSLSSTMVIIIMTLQGEAPATCYSLPRRWPGPSTLARPRCSSSAPTALRTRQEVPFFFSLV